jgi:virulence factor Mce-like protein
VTGRRSNAVIGGAALLALVLVAFGLTRFLGGGFKSGYEVTADFARAGQLLRPTSDVKVRGVLVGEVTRIDIEATGSAKVSMRLVPDQKLPDNVHATIRAKTLFGEKFVELSIPPEPTSHNLRHGSVIPESRTTPPLEVETILGKAVPILNAVDPEQFAGALHALAQAFVGNTDQLRSATLQSERLLTGTERTLPNFERNLVHLKHFSAALDQSDTDLLRALDGLTTVGNVLRAHPDEFRATVRNLVPLATDLGDILSARQHDLGVLAGQGRAVLQQVSDRASKLPSVVSVLDGFLGVWIADLSVGPNWRILVTNAPASGHAYPPGSEPHPAARLNALARISGKGPALDLADVLLAPVPTEDLPHAGGPRNVVVPLLARIPAP